MARYLRGVGIYPDVEGPFGPRLVAVTLSRRSDQDGVVAELTPEACLPPSPSGSGHANDLGRSEGRKAVQEGYDLKLDAEALKRFMLTKGRGWFDGEQKFRPEGHGFIQVNLGCPRATVDEAIRRLKSASLA